MSRIDRYMREARKFPKLSREEQNDLARRYHAGDRSAGDTLVCTNLRFAVKMAHGYTRHGAPLEDLVQEANLGLMRAVESFDPERGVAFITYARWWIFARLEAFCFHHSHALSFGAFNLIVSKEIGAARDAFPDASRDEIAARVAKRFGGDVSLERVRAIMDRRGSLSLDVPMSPDDGDTFVSTVVSTELSPEETALAAERCAVVRSVLAGLRLSERKLDYLRERLLADETTTLKVLAARHGVSRERSRQIEAGVKKEIRAQLKRSARAAAVIGGRDVNTTGVQE